MEAWTPRGRRPPDAQGAARINMSSHRIEIVNGHIIVCFDSGARMLLDTGSPLSMGRVPHELGDEGVLKWVPPITPEYLKENIGVEVNGLLGCDLLFRKSFEVDLTAGVLRIGEVTRDGDSHTIPLVRVAGVPVVEYEVDDGMYRAFLDTGARISYLDPSVPLVGETRPEEDFHPAIDRFPTEACRRLIRLDGQDIWITQGLQPEHLSELLQKLSSDIHSIVGIDVFRSCRVGFDVETGHIILTPTWLDGTREPTDNNQSGADEDAQKEEEIRQFIRESKANRDPVPEGLKLDPNPLLALIGLMQHGWRRNCGTCGGWYCVFVPHLRLIARGFHPRDFNALESHGNPRVGTEPLPIAEQDRLCDLLLQIPLSRLMRGREWTSAVGGTLERVKLASRFPEICSAWHEQSLGEGGVLLRTTAYRTRAATERSSRLCQFLFGTMGTYFETWLKERKPRRGDHLEWDGERDEREASFRCHRWLEHLDGEVAGLNAARHQARSGAPVLRDLIEQIDELVRLSTEFRIRVAGGVRASGL